MYAIDNATALAARPADAPAGPPGWFTDGNPAAGQPATILPASWLNQVQAELLGILTAAGIAPDKTKSNQLAQAVATLITNSSAAAVAAALATSRSVLGVNVGGGADVVLTGAQTAYGIITLTGVLTANINVIFPTTGRWEVINNTTGAFTATCKTQGGTGYIVRQGATFRIYGDGTNIAALGAQISNGSAAAPALQAQELYFQTS